MAENEITYTVNTETAENPAQPFFGALLSDVAAGAVLVVGAAVVVLADVDVASSSFTFGSSKGSPEYTDHILRAI